ncbi:MAG: iron-sulfur cluster assembly accessory protein [Thermodesulfovibrionia bacterium]
MLTITDNAVRSFKRLLEEREAIDYAIRIFTVEGGCCGPSLAMDIVEKPETGDIVIEKDGLKVFLENEAYRFLSEATIDFSDSQGFIISGIPQASCCS